MSLISINHEYVFTPKNLVEDMIKDSESLLADLPTLHSLLETAVGCIVTEDEHAKLTDEIGWGRYAGKIEVYDPADSPPLLVEIPVKDISGGTDEI